MFRRSIVALLLSASLLAGAASAKDKDKNAKDKKKAEKLSAEVDAKQQDKALKAKDKGKEKDKKKAASPEADAASKQPDKVLYDKAMKAMKQHKYDVARISLQTLINAYPESEFIARAKLAVAESWYREGTTAALSQAESEYRDFITFFPNMPEAAEAQLKIADIHYKQMGKPDRDFTHARHAQEEYRLLLQQYPDSKLVQTARLRLLEVQEVLAEREYRIGRFYFGRQSMLAAIARLKTLTDTYPLYSRADDAYFTLGQAYEQQAEFTRISKLEDSAKQRLIAGYEESAAQAYSRILTRYPAMPRAEEARSRLTAMKRAVPTPTAEAIELNKKEMASRKRTTRYERFVGDMGKRPDLSAAVHVGEPSMEDPKETDAPHLVREITSGSSSAIEAGKGGSAIKVEAAGESSTESQPAPHSQEAATVNPSDVPAQPLPQLNESKANAGGESTASSSSSTSIKDDPKEASSSRKKKRKFPLHIPSPF